MEACGWGDGGVWVGVGGQGEGDGGWGAGSEGMSEGMIVLGHQMTGLIATTRKPWTHSPNSRCYAAAQR